MSFRHFHLIFRLSTRENSIDKKRIYFFILFKRASDALLRIELLVGLKQVTFFTLKFAINLKCLFSRAYNEKQSMIIRAGFAQIFQKINSNLLLSLTNLILRPKKLIISLTLPRALLQKWPQLTFFHILLRLLFLTNFISN